MGRIFSVFALISIFSLMAPSAQSASVSTKGRVICSAVSKKDAVEFATRNHFLDNFDFFTSGPGDLPPYVPPVGTLACSVPVRVTKIRVAGQDAYQVDVDYIDGVTTPKTCTVFYYNGSRPRVFPFAGNGRGYLDLVPGRGDIAVSFSAFDMRYDTNEFDAFNIDRNLKIMWTAEVRDFKPHIPIVSNCHVKFRNSPRSLIVQERLPGPL